MRDALRCCSLAGFVAAAVPAGAQEPAATSRLRIPAPIPATTASISLDGTVTEELWQRALTLELRYEVRPGENIPPPVRTEMLLAHDDRNLYVAFRAYDDSPASIRARFTDRDNIFADDCVGVALDSFNDERRAYEFFANPLGVQADMLMDDTSGNEDSNWNAIWSSAGRVTATGFEVEMVIPFTQLRFQAADGAQTWGIDGIRSYPRRDRHHIGLFPRVRGENSYLGQEAKVSGFSGVRPGQNLEVVPTVTTVRAETQRSLRDGSSVRTDGDLGLSIKWGVTPNVTLNATVNPDFSQVEADSVQLDVNSQFALFFNETRPFFLEGADLFRTSRMTLLHTRQVAQPTGAVKASGKIGAHAFGFFSARDETTAVILPESQRSTTRVLDEGTLATVGRYRFDVGRNSTVGAMVTDRRGRVYANSVVAVDSRHRFSAADSVTATLAYSATRDDAVIVPAESGPRRAASAVDVVFNHSVRNWEAFANFRDYGKDFRADLGFMTQVNIRRWEYGGSRTWHGGPTQLYNRIQLSGNFDQTEERNHSLIEREWEGYLSMNNRRESYVQYGGGIRTRVYNGMRFDQVFQSAYAEIRPSRDLQLGINANWGDWIDFAHTRTADQRTVRPFVNLNYGRHLAVKYTNIFDWLEVSGGRLFLARVPELRVIYQRDARTLFRTILQYTTVRRDPALYASPVVHDSRNLFAQLLVSYKINPQTALYFGLSSGASATDERPLTSDSQTLFAKVSYAWLK
ncbi:MAG: DUF5916 domain-containing protein [Vicinamibacterales bacterium]